MLFALAAPERLSPAARGAIEIGPNRLSVLSFWEVVIKSMKGKLDVGDPRLWWPDALAHLAASALPFQPRHAATVLELPEVHADPFDRGLIAQAVAEDLVLVTADVTIAQYAVTGLRVIV